MQWKTRAIGTLIAAVLITNIAVTASANTQTDLDLANEVVGIPNDDTVPIKKDGPNSFATATDSVHIVTSASTVAINVNSYPSNYTLELNVSNPLVTIGSSGVASVKPWRGGGESTYVRATDTGLQLSHSTSAHKAISNQYTVTTRSGNHKLHQGPNGEGLHP